MKIHALSFLFLLPFLVTGCGTNTLSVTASATQIAEGGTCTFTASGGTAPYTYAVTSPSGSDGGQIDSSSGAYTAAGSVSAGAANPLTVTITATDSKGVTGTGIVEVTQ